MVAGPGDSLHQARLQDLAALLGGGRDAVASTEERPRLGEDVVGAHVPQWDHHAADAVFVHHRLVCGTLARKAQVLGRGMGLLRVLSIGQSGRRASRSSVRTVKQKKTEIRRRILNREFALGNFQRPAPPLGRTSASCGRPILVAVYVGDLRRNQLAALPMRQLRRFSEEAQRQRTMYGRGVLNDPPMILTCSWPTCGCRG
jgi:hypothetical protein